MDSLDVIELYEDSNKDKVKKFIDLGAKLVIMTLGKDGAIVTNGDETLKFKTFATEIVDTTGAGDAFFAGVAIGMTYGKELKEAVEIGTRLAASVIITTDNVCPRFLPKELGLDIEVEE